MCNKTDINNIFILVFKYGRYYNFHHTSGEYLNTLWAKNITLYSTGCISILF
jgi:hypothetical protein